MATNKFVNVDLAWARERLSRWRAFVDANPYEEVVDRISLVDAKNGDQIPVKTATIEQQHKDLRDTMKDYLALLDVVKRLEQDETKENSTYGGAKQSPRMKAYEDHKEPD